MFEKMKKWYKTHFPIDDGKWFRKRCPTMIGLTTDPEFRKKFFDNLRQREMFVLDMFKKGENVAHQPGTIDFIFLLLKEEGYLEFLNEGDEIRIRKK